MTGGDGAGTMAAAATANFTQWPPTSLVGTPTVANLYTYTQTGTPITMSVSTPPPAGSEGATVNAGNGWANAADTAPAYAPISGCNYVRSFARLLAGD
jgi:glucan 1,3-beta-glucosidase